MQQLDIIREQLWNVHFQKVLLLIYGLASAVHRIEQLHHYCLFLLRLQKERGWQVIKRWIMMWQDMFYAIP